MFLSRYSEMFLSINSEMFLSRNSAKFLREIIIINYTHIKVYLKIIQLFDTISFVHEKPNDIRQLKHFYRVFEFFKLHFLMEYCIHATVSL